MSMDVVFSGKVLDVVVMVCEFVGALI